jgi:hypothetical protein
MICGIFFVWIPGWGTFFFSNREGFDEQGEFFLIGGRWEKKILKSDQGGTMGAGFTSPEARVHDLLPEQGSFVIHRQEG